MTDIIKIQDAAELYASKIIINYSEKIVYHNFKFAKRLQKNIDSIAKEINLTTTEHHLSKICAWLFSASFENQKIKYSKEHIIETNILEHTIETANIFFEANPISTTLHEKINIIFNEFLIPSTSSTSLNTVSMVLIDSTTSDIVFGNGLKNLKKLYEEILLHNVSISKRKWLDIASSMAQSLNFHLPYCQEHFQQNLIDLQNQIVKEKKQIDKSSEFVLKKELDISDQELKQLKKNLTKIKDRDERAIQTVFRTTSKNHYTLNQMVDRKASIMITVNSIILSIVLGGIIGSGLTLQETKYWPIYILTLTSITSIIFAILSITPTVSHGQFTEDDIRNKKGNLLYYGNFYDMQERDFQWGFLQMLNDQNYLYSSMVKDLFYLGLMLKKKFNLIRTSLLIFLIGITLAVTSFLIINISGIV